MLRVALLLALCGTAQAQVTLSTPSQPSLVGTPNFAVGQVSVGTTATLVAAARIGRVLLTVTNSGTTAVFCGPTNAVTTVSGDVVGANTTFSSVKEYASQSAVWCIGTTATTVSFYELF